MKSLKTTVVLAALIASCGTTPKQAGHATQAGCTLVEALTDSAIVESFCALAPELAELGALVLSTRADAGSADAGTARSTVACKVIPTTTVCATNTETLAAVRTMKAKK
jgi:hypothetical protein